MTAGIIIQARLGSKRFPRKVLADLNGKTVLQHVIDRAKEIGPPVVLATCDKELMGYGGIPSILGPEDDVLARYVIAAEEFDFDPIMRLTADCPMLRPELCRKVLEIYAIGEVSYAAINERMTYPKGYGCEVFSRSALGLADVMAVDAYDREHVTPWMERTLKCAYLRQENDESHLNYCVDTPQDLERLKAIMNADNN